MLVRRRSEKEKIYRLYVRPFCSSLVILLMRVLEANLKEERYADN